VYEGGARVRIWERGVAKGEAKENKHQPGSPLGVKERLKHPGGCPCERKKKKKKP